MDKRQGRRGSLNDSKKAVREFMLSIALGFAAYIPLVFIVSLIANRFSLPILLGAAYGSAVMLLYYFLFARAMVKAAGEADESAAKKRIQAAYSLRMFILVMLIGAGIFLSTDYAPIKVFHWIPIIISMIIPRLSIAVWHIVNRAKDNAKDGEMTNGN